MKYLFKGHNASLVNHIFQTLLVTYLVLLLIEQIWKGSVSVYLNLNYFLVVVILAGVLDVFSEHFPIHVKKPDWKDYAFIYALGIAGFIIIKFKTASLGWLSWVISIIAGILIILLSLLVLEENSDENSEEKESNKTEKKIWDIYNLSQKQKSAVIKITFLFLVLLALISVNIAVLTKLALLESLRIVFGSVYVLFIPGFIISFIFFPKTKPMEEDIEDEYSKEDNEKSGSIDWIERIALSFALSIAIVPLAVFYLNLIGLKINLLNSSLTILGIILVSCFIIYFKNNPNKNIIINKISS